MLKDFEKILVSEEEIARICDDIEKRITDDYKNSGKRLVLICILKGSVMFFSELMKKIAMPIEIEFMKVSSYGAGTTSAGVINVHLDIKRDDLSDADFIIIEDLIDSVLCYDPLIIDPLCRSLPENNARDPDICVVQHLLVRFPAFFDLIFKPSHVAADCADDAFLLSETQPFLLSTRSPQGPRRRRPF